MPSSSSLVNFKSESSFETIEIDPQYASSLGLAQGDIVSQSIISFFVHLSAETLLKVDIGLLHDLPFADSVTTEPLTSDDWEIIVRLSRSLLPIQFLYLQSTLLN